MVKALHAAGIEVHPRRRLQPHLRGRARRPVADRSAASASATTTSSHRTAARYVDTTGCGNTLDVGDLDVLRLVLDSLRYWVSEMHVDGFRFDLATALTRERMDFDERSPFLAAVHQDPVLRQVKLIAEPWDVGPGGYRLGAFGSPWAEWNDAYRDDVRRFWRGAPGRPRGARRHGLAAHRLAGRLRRPLARARRSTSSPRTTASRCATSSPTTASTTRPTARTTATAPTTTGRGTTASRGRPTTARSRPRAAAHHARDAGHAAALDRYADARHGRRDRAARRAATTTPTTRTTRSPGCDWDLEPWQVDLLDWTTRARSTRAARTRRCARRSSSTAARSPRAGPPTSRGSRPDGTPMTDARLARPRHRHAS